MDTYKKIKLNGKLKLFTLVDDNDFELLSKYKWWAMPNGDGEIYAKSFL